MQSPRPGKEQLWTPVYAGGNAAGKQFRSPGWQQVEHEVINMSLLLVELVRLAATRVLCPVLDPSVKERHGHIGHSQTEGHQSNLLWKDAERVATVQEAYLESYKYV